jgi:hypothetical protein
MYFIITRKQGFAQLIVSVLGREDVARENVTNDLDHYYILINDIKN